MYNFNEFIISLAFLYLVNEIAITKYINFKLTS